MVALRFPFRKNKDKRKKKLSHYRKYTSKRIWSYFKLSFFGGQKRATRVEECECIDVGAIGRCRFKRSAGQEPSVRGGPPGWLTNRIRRYRRRRATGLGECCRGASWTRRRPVAATRGASRIPRWGPTRRATGPERGNHWKLGPSRAWPFSTLRAIFILIDDQEKKERNVNVERNAQGNKKKGPRLYITALCCYWGSESRAPVPAAGGASRRGRRGRPVPGRETTNGAIDSSTWRTLRATCSKCPRPLRERSRAEPLVKENRKKKRNRVNESRAMKIQYYDCFLSPFLPLYFPSSTHFGGPSNVGAVLTLYSRCTVRTVHGPSEERDAAGRRESGRSRVGVTGVAAARASAGASSFEGSEARRLGSRPEFGTQLEADVRVAWKAERHLQRSSGTRQQQEVDHFHWARAIYSVRLLLQLSKYIVTW